MRENLLPSFECFVVGNFSQLARHLEFLFDYSGQKTFGLNEDYIVLNKADVFGAV